MKRVIYVIFLLSVFISLFAQKADTKVRICVIGDRTGNAQEGVYEGIFSEIVLLRPDFILTVGDMIEGPAESYDIIKKRWDEYFEIVNKTDIPIFYTPGNNDIFDSISYDYYSKNVSKPYYSLDTLGIHLICLDNSRISSSSKMDNEQTEFLVKDLKKQAKNKSIIVIMHKPFWKESVSKGKEDELHNIFKEYGVDLVLSGHYHEYFTGEYDGVKYVSVGSSGGAAWADYAENMEFHYTFITFDKNGMHIAPIRKGSVLQTDFVTDKENDIINSMINSSLKMEKIFYDDQKKKINTDILSLKLNNITESQVKDTLFWESDNNWEISPNKIYVNLLPKEEKTYTFEVKNTGMLFPLPKAGIKLKYNDDYKQTVFARIAAARQTVCTAIKSSIVIDGELSEKMWKDPVFEFSDENGDNIKFDSTYLYMMHDKKNVYFGVECSDKNMEKAPSMAFEHDGAVYDDDCVSFLISSGEERECAYVIYVNPTGVVYDAKVNFKEGKMTGVDEKWESGAVVKTTGGRHGWNAELSIPLDSLNIDIKKDKGFRMNFFRQNILSNSLAVYQLPLAYDISTYGYIKLKN